MYTDKRDRESANARTCICVHVSVYVCGGGGGRVCRKGACGRGVTKPVRLAEGSTVLQKEGGNHPSRPVSFFFGSVSPEG